MDKLSRYIEFSENNFSTYSIEILRLYLTICSEIDVVLKELCKEISSERSPENIKDYRKVISEELKEFNEKEAVCYKFGLRFVPWLSWNENISPEWWKDHNKVKHQRNDFYEKANLKNVLESLSALYLANLYLSFVKDKKSSQGFTFVVEDTIPKLPAQLEFFRVGSLFPYLRE